MWLVALSFPVSRRPLFCASGLWKKWPFLMPTAWPAPLAAHLDLDLELINHCPPSHRPGGHTAQEGAQGPRYSVDIADEGVIFRSRFSFLAEIIK